MEPISMTVDFIELMDYTVEITDRVLKVAHNVVRLEESDDIFMLSETDDFDISEDDDVVIFKNILDKYSIMRNIDYFQEQIIMTDDEERIIGYLIPRIEEAKEALEEIGDLKIEKYKLVINSQIYDAEYKGRASDY
jgi:hypothetical protein